jgi:ATP phosphoribosyltransferase
MKAPLESKPFTIALPAGRMSEESLAFLDRIGFARFTGPVSRELSFFDESNTVRILLVRNQDVPLCLLHGGAEAGVCGRDVILEHRYDLTVPVSLPFGHCRLSVAALAAQAEVLFQLPHIRVATKYPHLASRWFHERGLSCEIIRMHGSIEVAPLMGIADCIVDLVSTGNTLRANGLVELEIIQESTALLLVNRSAYALQNRRIMDLIRKARLAAS